MATKASTRSTSATPRRRSAVKPSTEQKNGAGVPAAELQELLVALRAAKRGERGLRIDARRPGIMGELARAFNEL